MKVVVIIQARLDSSRLPRKILSELGGSTVLEHIVRRCKEAKTVDDVVVACPDKDEQAIFARTGIMCHPGPEKDILTRLLNAALARHATHMVRVTGDCPLVCPRLIDQMVGHHAICGKPVVANWKDRTYPDGFDLECYDVAWLDKFANKLKDETDREYFAQYILENCGKAVESLTNRVNLAYSYRCTVDYPEDLRFMRSVYKHMEERIWDFEEIIDFLQSHPYVTALNKKRIDGLFGKRPE